MENECIESTLFLELEKKLREKEKLCSIFSKFEIFYLSKCLYVLYVCKKKFLHSKANAKTFFFFLPMIFFVFYFIFQFSTFHRHITVCVRLEYITACGQPTPLIKINFSSALEKE